MRERMRRAVVTNRTGRFGNRTRRITRTWDVIKTKNVYTIRRAKSGRAATAGRPVVTAMPTAATAAESPPAPSRLTSWKSRSATRYSRGRTSAVRKKSNSDAWAVTPAPSAYSMPKDRRPASGAARTPMAAVVSASLTVVPRVTPKAKPDGRKIKINARYASGPNRPRRAGPKKNRSLYVNRVKIRPTAYPLRNQPRRRGLSTIGAAASCVNLRNTSSRLPSSPVCACARSAARSPVATFRP